MTRYHNIDGKKVPFTSEEESARDAEEAKWEADKPRREAQKKIRELEKEITPRRQREAILGTDNGWLASKEAEINALRQ